MNPDGIGTRRLRSTIADKRKYLVTGGRTYRRIPVTMTRDEYRADLRERRKLRVRMLKRKRKQACAV